MLHLTKI